MKNLLKRLWRRLTHRPELGSVSVELEKAASAQSRTPPSPMLPLSRVERTLVVGVDFGTSSTKVIWQDLSDNHFEIFRWSRKEDGLRALMLPSAIVVRNDVLYFG